MQKTALSVSITLLALGLVFVGVSYTSPGLIQGWVSKVHPEPAREDAIIFDGFSGDGESGSSEGGSARVLGESTSETPSPAPKQQQYQYQAPLPTAIPTQEPVVQQAQEHKTAWDGYANKEAFCKDIADRVTADAKRNPPQVDQSNLPPELRVSPNWDVWWSGAYQDCMNQIRDY